LTLIIFQVQVCFDFYTAWYKCLFAGYACNQFCAQI
jgi:hypothetical protein